MKLPATPWPSTTNFTLTLLGLKLQNGVIKGGIGDTMAEQKAEAHSWFYNNIGTLLLAVLLFLGEFVFTDFHSTDKKLQGDFEKLSIQVAELNASMRPIIASFSLLNTTRYTSEDAAKDNRRIQQQLEELKAVAQRTESRLQDYQQRLSRLEAKQ